MILVLRIVALRCVAECGVAGSKYHNVSPVAVLRPSRYWLCLSFFLFVLPNNEIVTD